MWKLSVITDEVSQSLPEVVAFARRFGLAGLEIRSVNGRSPFEFTPEDHAEIKQTIAGSGLAMCAFSLPLFKCALGDAAAYAAHLDGLKRAIELADACGCRLLRGFTFWNAPGELPLAQIVEAYAPVLPLLEQADMTVVLECEPAVYAASAPKLAAVIDAIGHPRVQAVWDGTNLLYGDDASVLDGYVQLQPYIRHVHIKDAVRTADGTRSVPVGEGDADIPGQLRLLRQDGYDGWLSLETHYRSRQLDEAKLRMPAGYAFSEGGMEASTQSMQNLLAMLQAIQ